MNTVEKLLETAKSLNPVRQLEALQFVDQLSKQQSDEDLNWSRGSLELALRGMESEVWPDYQDTDYLEKWQ